MAGHEQLARELYEIYCESVEGLTITWLQTEQTQHELRENCANRLRLPLHALSQDGRWLLNLNQEIVGEEIRKLLPKANRQPDTIIDFHEDDFANSDGESVVSDDEAGGTSAPPTYSTPVEMTVATDGPRQTPPQQQQTQPEQQHQERSVDNILFTPTGGVCLIIVSVLVGAFFFHALFVDFAKKTYDVGWPVGVFAGLSPLAIVPIAVGEIRKQLRRTSPRSAILTLCYIGFLSGYVGALIFGGIAAGFTVAYERQENYVKVGLVTDLSSQLPAAALEARGYHVTLPTDIVVDPAKAIRKERGRTATKYRNRVCVAPIMHPEQSSTNYFMVYDGNNDLDGLCNTTSSSDLTRLFSRAMQERDALNPPLRDFVRFTYNDKEVAIEVAKEIATTQGFTTVDPPYILYGPDPEKKQKSRRDIINGMLIGTACWCILALIIILGFTYTCYTNGDLS
ncbi:MAG: hypothetical protein MHM6MM_003629 [Cercozoa sp. M6MM]